ncbi:hypothetical protein HMPREF9598_02227 [Cutibacterium acnes HL050PA1]|nr:hypothetical protein HMPREF9567_00457 [Cutibacterium acnes HL013PA1]EFS81086.1 hypothetical protein HMPREF9598_02227 [Cutibacterium acnes HL050PA1]EFS99564.1 hypothetical protein HMPREF9609_01837 [Cutibacterium acnes HL027PA1]EGF03168.1 hypothetical protein HMPREF9586_00891 [Cutibacterium acnes HL083PA2]EGF69825.1 hypothetical protein HMPREF9579_00697 [Cutibacterium acnes HL087PA1]
MTNRQRGLTGANRRAINWSRRSCGCSANVTSNMARTWPFGLFLRNTTQSGQTGDLG